MSYDTQVWSVAEPDWREIAGAFAAFGWVIWFLIAGISLYRLGLPDAQNGP